MQTSQFIRNKGQVLEEFARARRQAWSGVAGRNFSFEPGFMYEFNNELEIDTKMKLSELNYKLLEEMVNQDLKRKGLDYDLAYKSAAIAWELEKAGLFADWEKELADIKNTRALDFDALKLLALEVSKRGNLLIEAKAAIDLEIEGYRKQIEDLDSTTVAYEIRLAQAKMATAQKKLDILPYIQDLIDIETLMIAKEDTLLNKAQLMYNKELQLVQAMQGIVNKEYIVVQYQRDDIFANYNLLAKHSDLIASGHAILPYRLSMVQYYNALLSKEQTISQLQQQYAFADTQLSNARVQEINTRTGLLSTKANIENQEQIYLNTKVQSVNMDSQAETSKIMAISERYNTLTQTAQVIADKANVQASEANLLNVEGLAINARIPVVTAQKAVIDQQQVVVNLQAQLQSNYDQLILIEQDIARKTDDIVLVSQDTAQMVRDTTIRMNDIIVATDALNTSKQNTLNAYNALYQNEQQKMIAEGQLIDAEQTVVNFSLANLQPEVQNLITEINNYALSLAQQVQIQQDIFVEKGNVINATRNQINQTLSTLQLRQQLSSALTTLSQTLSTFITTKVTTLSGQYASLAIAQNTEINAKQRMTTIHQSIASIKTQIANLISQKVQYEIDIMNAEQDKQASMIDVKQVELDLSMQSLTHKIDMLNQEITNFNNYSTSWATVKNNIDVQRALTFNTVKNNRALTMTTEFNTQIGNQTTLENEERRAIYSVANADIYKDDEYTNAKTQAKAVTAKLTHLLI